MIYITQTHRYMEKLKKRKKENSLCIKGHIFFGAPHDISWRDLMNLLDIFLFFFVQYLNIQTKENF